MTTERSPAVDYRILEGVVVVRFDQGGCPFQEYEEVDRLLRPFCDQLGALLEAGGYRRVLLDLSGIRYMTHPLPAYGIRLFKRLRELGGVVKVCNIPDMVLGYLRMVRLDRLGELHPDRPADPATVLDLFRATFPEGRLDAFAQGAHRRTLRQIAQAIHDEERFDTLPVLADALEEAGCDDPDLLHHCRHGQHHIRGCWVIERLLR